MKDPSHRLRSLLTTTALTVLAVLPSGLVRANPEGGNVVAGSATIATSDKTVDVTQQTDRAVIDWRSFNIGVDERTRFFQPNANSIIVNRVNDANPSAILGSLSANGNVVLINPNGVFFGKNAVVDVNGMLATTADIDNNAFMSGSNKFDKASSNTNAVIINNGQITAKEAGLIGLVAPNVINNGVINAKLGRVELASGDTVTVDFRGNGLTEIAVGDEVKQQLVKNTGQINAAGGTIAITAAAGKNIVNSLIDIKGELKAPAFAQHNGTISIFAAGSNKTNKSGSSHVTINAKLDVSGKNANEHGGNVTITGDHIDVQSGTIIDASGDTGGGNVLIGGDAHGAGITPTSITTTVEKDTFILTNAITTGDGGKTILWSDDSTVFAGNIEGRSATGKGGFVETSGKQNLTTTGNVDLRGTNDSAGTWLLDPTNISIVNRSQTGTADQVNTISADYIETQSNTANVSITADNTLTLDLATDTINLANNRDLTLTATSSNILSNSAGTIKSSGTGSITLNAAGTGGSIYFSATGAITFNAQGTGNVTLKAGNGVSIGNASAITTHGGTITLNADTDANAIGNVYLGTVTIASNGGNIIMGGGTNPNTTYAYGQASAGNQNGIYLNGTTVNATGTSSGGNIILNGAGWALSTANTGSSIDAANGIMFNGATVQTNFNGTITSSALSGGTTGSTGSLGIYLYNTSSISTANGSISITANQGTIGGGFLFSGAGTNKVQSTGTGNISIISTNASITFSGATSGIFSTSGNVALTTTYFGNNSGNGGVIGGNSATGTITITSSGSSIDYTNLIVKTTGSVILTTPTASSTSINVATGSGGFYLPTNFLNSITAGSITIGSSTSNGVMTVGAYTWANDVNFLLGNNNITFNGTQTLSGKNLTATVSGVGNKITTAAMAVGAGNITLTSDDVVIGGALSGTGTITLRPNATSRPVNINYGPNDGTDYNLSTAEVANLTDGWSLINIGRTDGSIDMNLGNITFTDPLALVNNFRIQSNGNITLTDNASLNVTNASSWFNVIGNITTNNQAVNISILGGYGGTITTSGGAVSVSNTIALRQLAGAMMTINTSGGNITIAAISDGSVGSTTGRSVVLNAGTGNVTFTGSMNSNTSLTASGNTITLNNAFGGSIATGNITLTSVGNMSVAAITTVAGSTVALNATGAGSKITTAAIATGTAGNITLTSDDVAINGALSGTGTLTLQPYTVATRAVDVNAGPNDGTDWNLSTAEIALLTNGWSLINIGSTSGGGTFTIGNSSWVDPVVFRNNYRMQASGTTITGTDDASLTFNPGASGWFNFNNASGTTITTAGQAVSIAGAFNNINLVYNGTINTSGGNVSFLNNVTAGSSTSSSLLTVNAGSGTVSFGGIVNSSASDVVDLNITGATITTTGAWGGSVALGNVTLTATNNLTLPAITTVAGKTVNATATGAGSKITTAAIATGAAGNITLTSDDVTIGGALSGTGVLTLQPYATSRYVNINNSTDNGTAYYLDTTELSKLTDGWSQINIGRTDSTGYLTSGTSTWSDPVVFRGTMGGTIATSQTLSATDNATVRFSTQYLTLSGTLTTAGTAVTIDGPLFGWGTAGGGVINTNGGSVTAGSIQTNISGGSNNLTINTSGGNVTINGGTTEQTTSSAGKLLTINAGAGTVTLGGINHTAMDVTVNAATITLGTSWANYGTLGNLTLTATNSITLPAIVTAAGKTASVTVTGAGNKITTSTIATGAAGSISLTSDDVTIGGALSGTGTLTLQQNAITRGMRINSSSDDGSTYYLDTTEVGRLTDGWSSILIGNVGTTVNTNMGGITFTDPVTFRTAAYRQLNGGNLVGTDNASFNFQGGTSFDIFKDIVTAGGALTVTTNLYSYGGNISTNGGAINLNVTGIYNGTTDYSINSGNGNITVYSIVQGGTTSAGKTLTVNAGTGTLNITGYANTTGNLVASAATITANTGNTWSSTTGNITLTATNSIILPSITTAAGNSVSVTVTGAGNKITENGINVGAAGNITLTSDDVTLTGALVGTGTVTLRQNSITRIISINDTTNAPDNGINYFIDTTEIAKLTDGWSQINIGRSDSTAYYFLGAETWTDPVNIINSGGRWVDGNITGTGNASLSFSSGWTNINNGSTISTSGQSILFTQLDTNSNNGTISSAGGNVTIGSMQMRPGGATPFTINSGGGNIVVNNDITEFNGSTAGRTLIFNAGTGNVSLFGKIDGAYDLSVTGTTLTASNAWGSSVGLGNITLSAVNNLTLPSVTTQAGKTVSVTVSGAGSSITTAAIATGTGGNISLMADDLVIGGSLSGTGSLVLKPNSTSRIVNINNGTADGSNFNISTAEISNMATGWGSITIGSSTNNGTFTSGANTWNSSVVFLSKNGDININGAQTIGTNTFTATTSGTGNIVFNSGSITTTATGNAITLTSGGSINSTSGLSAANGIITLTSVGSMTIAPTTSAGLIATVSGAGNSITAGAISVGSGNISMTADDVILNGNLTGTGTLTLQPYATTRTMDINFGPNDGTDFNISTAEIGRFVDGWSMINLGRLDGATPYEINTSTWTDPVTFRNGNRRDITGPVTGTNEASFTFVNGWDSITYGVTTAGQAITYTNATIYGGAGTINSNGGAINIFQIGVFNGNSGTNINSGNGNITIGSIIESGTSSAGKTQNINAGTGTLNITGTVNGAMNVTASAATITLGGVWGGTTALGTVSLTATNSMTLPAISASTVNATVTGTGNRITTGTITTGTGGNITLTSDDMTIGGALSGTGTITLQNNTSTRNININDTTNGITDDGTYLFFDQNEINRLSTGWGQINIGTNSAGLITYLGTATFTNPLNLKPIGTTYLDGAITGTGNASITINGSVWARDGSVTTAGQNIVIGALTAERGATFTTNGGNFTDNNVFRMSNTYNSLNAVTVSTSGGNITISSNLNEVGTGGSLSGKNITLNAGTGNVAFGSIANGTYNVSVIGSGITFNGSWGATTAFGNLTFASTNSLVLPAITTAAGKTVTATVTGAGNKITTSTIATGAAGNITLQSDDLVVAGALSGTGTITLQPNSTTRLTDIAMGANDGTDWNLSTAEMAYLTDGWSQINIGRTDSTVGFNLGTTSWSDPVHFRNNSANLFSYWGNITGTDNASITFDGNGNNIYPGNSGQTIQTNNQNITFNGSIRQASTSTIVNTATFNAGTGTIAFNNGITNGASGYALNIIATANTITFGGTVGGTSYPLGTLTLTTVNSITLPAIYASNVNVTVTGAGNKITTGAITSGTGGNITLTSDDVTIGGALSGTGTLTLQQANSSRVANINSGTDDGSKYFIDSTEISRLTDGWSSILIGNPTYGGDINIGASTWTDPVTFRAANYRGVNGNLTGTGDASFTFSGGVSVNVIGNITTAGQAVTFGTGVISYAWGGTITTNGGAVNLYRIGNLNGSGNLTINTAGGNITNTSGMTTAGTTAVGKVITLNAGTGNISFGAGADGAGDISLIGATITLTGTWGATTPLGNVTLSAVNSLTLPAITTAAGKTVSVTASGAGSKITTAAIATGAAGNITLTADDLAIGGNLSGTGTVTLQPYSTARQIAINYSTDDGTKFYIDSTEASKFSDGWSQIIIGRTDTSLDYYINGTSWTDPINFRGRNINVAGTLTLTDNAALSFTTAISTGIATNAVINSNGNNITFSGILSGWGTNGTINTGGGNVTIASSTTAYANNGSLTINTGGGNITGNAIYDGAGGTSKSLTFNAGTGNVSFSGTTNMAGDITISAATITLTGAVGGTTPTGNLSLTATNNLILPSITTAAGKTVTATVTGAGNKITTGAITTGTGGNITLTSDDVTIGGNLSGTGTLTLQQNSTTRAARINYSTDDGTAYYLDTTEISKLVDGWSSVIIGNATNTAAMNIGASTWTDPTTFRTNGYKGINNDINGTDNASFTFLTTATNSVDVNHNITTAGGAVTFGTNINAIGVNGIITTNGGAVSTYNFATFNGTGGLTVNTSGGNITVTNVMFTSGTTAAGKVINLNAGTGNVSIANSISGDYDLVVYGATITAGGAWNSGTALGNITLTATNSITLPAIATAAGKTVSVTVTGAGNKITTSVIGTGAAGNITLTSDDVTIGSNLSGTGTLTLQQNAVGRGMLINSGTDDGSNYYLDTTELSKLVDGWTTINIGNTATTASSNLGNMTFTDPVAFRTGGFKQLTGNLIGTGNASFTFTGGTLTMASGSSITTAGGLVYLGGNVNTTSASVSTSGGNFTITNQLFLQTAGTGLSVNTGGGNISVGDHISGGAAGQSVVFNAGAGTVTIAKEFNGPYNVSVTGQGIAIGLASGATTALGDVTLTSVNSLTLPSITTAAGKTVTATVTGAGNKITTSDITTGTGGNITLTSDDVTIGGNLSGTGTLVLQPNATSRVINIAKNTDDGTGYYLDTTELGYLVDGWSQVAVGRTNTAAVISIGSVTIKDPTIYRTNGNISVGGSTFAATGDGSFTFGNVGSTAFTLNSLGFGTLTTAGGSVTFNTAAVNLNGGFNINTNGGNIVVATKVTTSGGTGTNFINFNAGSGNITIPTIDNAFTAPFTVTLAANNITLSNAMGATNALGAVTLTAVNSLTLPSITASSVAATVTGAGNKITTTAIATGAGGNITLTSDDVTIGGALSGTGTLTLQQNSLTRVMRINNGTDDGSYYYLDTTEMGRLTDGWSQINFSRSDSTADLYTYTMTVTDPVSFLNGGAKHIYGNLTASGNASVTFANAPASYTELGGTITTAGQAVSYNNTMVAYSGAVINTNGGNVSTKAISIADNLSINTAGGSITVNGNIVNQGSATGQETKTVTLNAGTAVLSITGNITTTAAIVGTGSTITTNATGTYSGLGNLTLTATNSIVLPNTITTAAGKTVSVTVTGAGNKITAGAIATGAAGNITLTSDDVAINGALSGTGTLTLQPYAATRVTDINYGPNDGTDWNLSTAEITNLSDGWNSILIGNTSNTTANFEIGASTWTDPITFRNNFRKELQGNLVGTGNASFTFNGTNVSWLNVSNASTITTNGGDVALTGGMTLNTTNNITTNGGNLSLGGIVNVSNNNATFSTSGGNITFGNVIRENGASTAGKTLTLNAGTGTVSFANTVNVAANLSVIGATITTNGAWGGTTALGALSLTSANNISLPAINAASVLIKATGASAGITTTGQITTTATGNALVLAGQKFTNTFGATALNATNGGRFLVWSADPSADSRNGISYAFKQYNAVYGTTTVAGTGSGFLYSIAPTISIALQNVNKTYDGTNVATLTGANYTLGSSIDGDTLAFSNTSTTYDDKNVGSNKSVTASGISIAATNGSATVYGYQYNTSVTSSVGNVSAANLTITANDKIKTYGSTVTFNGNEYTQSGLFSGDTISGLTIASSGAAATANASMTPYAINASNAAGTGLSNYNITYVDGNMIVLQKGLTITASDSNKTYGDTKTFAGSEFTTNGLVNSDTVTSVSLASAGAAATATVAGGPYTITDSNAVGTGLSNYSITYVGGHLTIDKANLTVTANSSTKTYGDTVTYTGNEFTVSGLKNTDTATSATITSSGAGAMADASVTPYDVIASGATGTGLENYNVSYVNGGLTVNKANLTITANSGTKTYGDAVNYTGIEYAQSGLVNGDTISGLTITSAGAAATSHASATAYAVTATNASGSRLSNYNISYVDGGLTVNKANLTVTANSSNKTYGDTLTYTGTEFTTVGLKNADMINTATITSAGAAATATVAGGPYSVVISNATGTDLSNYNVSYVNGGLTMGQASLTIVAQNQVKEYGDIVNLNGTEFISSGLKNSDNITSVALASSGGLAGATVAGGPYTITIGSASGNGLDNYAITYVNGTFAVNQAGLTIVAQNQVKQYGDSTTFNGTEYVSSGLRNGDTISSVVLSSAGAAATASVSGSPYSINVSDALGTGLENYAITYVNGTYAINKANLTVTSSSATKTYGDTVVYNGTQFTASGLKNSDTVTSATITSAGAAATANANATPYDVAISNAAGTGLSNYTITYVDGGLTVNKANLSITANDKVKTYGNTVNFAGNEFTVSGLLNTDHVSNVTIASSGAAATANASMTPYAVIASNAAGTGLSNYNISYTDGNMVVLQKALTITVNDATKDYGVALTIANNSFTANGLVNSDNISGVTLVSSGTAATANVSGSPYTISASNAVGTGLSNYNVTYVGGHLTVNPIALTVTANNQTKTYGQTTTFNGTEFSSIGLINGDHINAISLMSSGAAASASASGTTYSIVGSNASGAGLSNYVISYVDGGLTINKANLTLTANDINKTYGTTLNFTGSEYNANGLVNGDQITGLSLSSAGAAATATVAGGPYGINISNAIGANLSNYNITYVGGTLNVAKADLNISAKTYIKQYLGTLGLSGYHFLISGLQNADTVTHVDLASAGAAATAPYGLYTVTVGNAIGTGLDNYNITYHNGTITIPAPTTPSTGGITGPVSTVPQTVESTSQSIQNVIAYKPVVIAKDPTSVQQSLVNINVALTSIQSKDSNAVTVMNNLVEIDPALINEINSDPFSKGE